MVRRSTSLFLIVLVSALFFFLVLINNHLLGRFRIDLTEQQIYSLSQGSQQILRDLDEPINLYFFFSEQTSKGYTALRNYADRVKTLLKSFESHSDGKIILQLIDPEPFSDQEDRAAEFGLTAATVGLAGESIYLGLAGTNSLDAQQVIGFFDPQQEQFLEYEVTKLIYQLSQPEKVKVGIISSLPIAGGANPLTGQFDEPWAFYRQLTQLYDTQLIEPAADQLPEELDVLMLVHVKTLSESLRFAIDQYAMNGGRLFAFVDPHHESTLTDVYGQPNSSNLSGLLTDWGIKFDESSVLLDAQLALEIRTQTGIAKHLGYVGFSGDYFDQDDVVTRFLELINSAAVGHFSFDEELTYTHTPLIVSSQHSDMMNNQEYALSQSPDALTSSYSSKDQSYEIASRISGYIHSAYSKQDIPDSIDAQHWKPDTQKFNAILVADTDLLVDHFWGQQSNFFGETIFTPFANNGDLVVNGVENLAGSDALISIRARGSFSRPFDKVDALTVSAEAQFREKEQELQRQLDDTELQLAQLQNAELDSGTLVINEKQQAAIDEFIAQKIEIRKALRKVQHDLDNDINQLGSILKLINIALAPLCLVLCLFFMFRLFRPRAHFINTD